MGYVNINLENLDKEHLCCAIADKKHQDGVDLKKSWLKDRLSCNHVFRKLDAKGKVFIEYDDLELSWVPIVGDNYLYIYCLWVSGSFKGNGHANALLEYAINDARARGKKGLCVLSSIKKKPFLSEKSFFLKYGFKVVDSIGDFELLALAFDDEVPCFTESARKMKIDSKKLTIFYSVQCPYTSNCIKEIKECGVDVDFILVDSLEKAKNLPCVFNNWAFFKDGKYVSSILLNKNSFEKNL